MRTFLFLNLTSVILLFFPCINYGQAPNLGTTDNFALFTAAGAFNNIGASTVVTGDVGTDVGAFNAFPPGTLIGAAHVADAVSAQAATDVLIAYNQLEGLLCGSVLGVTLGNGQVLTPNIYCTGAATTLNGNLTLDAENDPSAVFVFQIDGALATSTFSNIFLINGANLCNVYWQINGMFTLDESSVFVGTVIVDGAISLHSGSILNGRALSTAGAISTSSNTVTMSLCQPPEITCPPPVVVSCANEVPAPNIGLVNVTATCPGNYTVIFSGDVISNQTCLNRYSITRTYQVTDACGITATCSQSITVNDQTPPVISCPANFVTCDDIVPAPVPASIIASDLCGGVVTVLHIGDVVLNQITTRTYQATDICGNTTICAQLLSVLDDDIPVDITFNPLFCLPSSGPLIGLSSTVIGVIYQLQDNGGNNLGSPIVGTGGSINFGTYPNGTYTVVATGADCSNTATTMVNAVGEICGLTIPNFCICDEEDGRAIATIKVTAPEGQIWVVKNVIGLYAIASPPVPNAPTPLALGTALNYIGGNMYTLDAIRLTTQGFWVQVTNGSTDFDILVGNPSW